MTQISPVPPAIPDPVSDRTLARMIDVAREAHHGQCTDEGALLLLQNLAPCLEELLDYRRRALASLELVPDIMPANVIRMDPRP